MLQKEKIYISYVIPLFITSNGSS